MRERRPSWHWWWLALLVPALLSPPVFAAVRALTASSDAPAWLEQATFGRVFQRLLMVAGLAVAVPWFWGRGVRGWAAVGLCAGPGRARSFTWGAAWALALAAAQLGLHLATGAREWEAAPALTLLAGIAATAVAVAFLEEALFRGALQGVLRQGMGPAAAVALQAAIFATAHFLKPPGFGTGFEPRAWSGFELLASVPAHICTDAPSATRWVVLFLLGAALGAAAVRWRGIWWCAGFHAVVAGAALSIPRITDYEGGPWRPLCAKSIDASPDVAVLLAILLVALAAWRRPAAPPETPPP